MTKWLSIFLRAIVSMFRLRRNLAFENLLLRQQLAVLKCKGVRPPIDPKIRGLIRRMCEANPLWGAPRIHGELLKLGIKVSEAVVSKYMIRYPKPPSQTWRTPHRGMDGTASA